MNAIYSQMTGNSLLATLIISFISVFIMVCLIILLIKAVGSARKFDENIFAVHDNAGGVYSWFYKWAFW